MLKSSQRRHQSRAAAIVALIVLACVGAPYTRSARAGDYPEPSVYPIAWELKFEHSTPRRIVVQAPGSDPEAYWFMTYTVTNNSGEEQVFLPNFELLTDEGKIVKADRRVPREAFDKIKAQVKNKYLEPATKITGEIRLGETEARDGVAIFHEPKRRLGTFSIFCGGLSGEFVIMKDKQGKTLTQKNEKTGEEEPVILRKTLQLTYHINGDEVYPGEDVVNEGESRTGSNPERWIMR